VTIQIPGEIARDLVASRGDLLRRALKLDGFLRTHAMTGNLPTLKDLERERQDLRGL